MGVSHKCFEILENRPHDDPHGSLADTHTGEPDEEEDEADDDASDEDEDDEEEEDNSTAIGAPLGIDPDETESEMSDRDSDTDSWDGSDDGRSNVRLRLREILFYDDKVSIFKARHGRL